MMVTEKVNAQLIRELRLKRGFSLSQVARLLGVSESHISKIETGKAGVGGALLLKIADLYNVRPEDLFIRDAVPADDEEDDLPPPRVVDLIAEVYKSDYVLVDGEQIDVRPEAAAWRMEMATRMGAAWAKNVAAELNERTGER